MTTRFDAPRPESGSEGFGERHIHSGDLVTMRVDETDEWIEVPVRSVLTPDGTGWSFEIGPYSVTGSDAARLINALAEYGQVSGEFRQINRTDQGRAGDV